MHVYDSEGVEDSLVMINEFVLNNCFNVVYDDDENKIYWLHTKEQDGYVLIWPSGESFHTYRHPEEWFDVQW